MNELTLDDVLSVRHPVAPRWSRDNHWLAFTYHVGGVKELWAVPVAAGDPFRLSATDEVVTAWDWGPGRRLAYACRKEIWIAEPGGSRSLLLTGHTPIAEVKWSPDGRTLGVLRGGELCLLAVPAGEASPARTGAGSSAADVAAGPLLRDLATPGSVTPTFHWSPDGARLACPILSGTQRDLVVIDVATGELVWRTETPDFDHGVAWCGVDQLSFARLTLDSTRREYVLAAFTGGPTEAVLEREESQKGLKPEIAPVCAPAGDAIAYTLAVDGWMHVVLRDLARGTRKVLLPGAHEDIGHANDQPAFSADGRYLAFASNQGALQERHLWCYDRRSDAIWRLTSEPGTQVNPAWSLDGRRVAFIACTPWSSAEVAVIGFEVAKAEASPRRLTRSMPAAWRPEAITEPRHLTFPSVGGMEIHADLFLPKGFDPGRKHPALVYVHGGPMRQMRYGWHPLHTYAVFHSFNQYLLHRGYVVLSVDFRGGIGYGIEYEQANHLQFGQADMEDCVNGAQFLKSQPYVDGESIAIWGISYGGYLTLACLTKRPEVFALGINIAGVWDQEQWAGWRARKEAGVPSYFERRWGGPKAEHNAEIYRQISPKYFVTGLRAPLLNLHGTADEAVDFAQLDAIVRDCTAQGKDFALVYYPGESHMFTKRETWEDAFRRMVAAFDRYLKVPPGERPAAML